MSSDLRPRRKNAQFSHEVPQLILQSILADSAVGRVLPNIRQLHLPDWWLAGGAIRNTVWKSIYGDDCQLAIKDFDVAFYDANGNREQERSAKETLETQFPGSVFDIKNQASFATWRAGRRTYASSLDGIADWQHTATAVGVKLDQDGRWWFIAPFGFDDLLSGVVRLGPAHFDSDSAIQKGQSYLLKCPALTTAKGFVPCLTNPFVGT
jgi:hypothetical protein